MANTIRSYAEDWVRFTAWCQRHQLDSLPPPVEELAGFLTKLAELSKKWLPFNAVSRPFAALRRQLLAQVWLAGLSSLVYFNERVAMRIAARFLKRSIVLLALGQRASHPRLNYGQMTDCTKATALGTRPTLCGCNRNYFLLHIIASVNYSLRQLISLSSRKIPSALGGGHAIFLGHKPRR